MEIEMGSRVAGTVQGQAFTGKVITRVYREAVLESITVRTDRQLTTPAGRLVRQAFITGESLQSIRPI